MIPRSTLFVPTLLLLVAHGASSQILLPEAPWTPAEHASLVSLADGCRRIGSAYSLYFNPRRDENFVADRNVYSHALQDLVLAWGSCLEATQRLYGMRGAAPGAGRSLVATTIARLEAVELPENADSRRIERALRSLREFDPKLPYADVRPAIYPRMIGSHGDHDWALAQLAEFQDQILPAADALAKLIHGSATPVVSTEALEAIGIGAARLQRAVDASLESASLSVFVIGRISAQLIAQDVAAAGGIRDENFFRGVLALEHATGGGSTPRSFSGRRRARSAVPSLFSSTQSVNRINHIGRPEDLGSLNGPDWLLRQLDGGLLQLYRKHVFEAWQHADNYVFGMMGFFHSSPVPPRSVPIDGPLLPESPWTPAEHESLVHLVRAFDLASESVATAILERNSGAAATLALTGNQLTNAMFALVNAPRRSKADRETTVELALRNLAFARRRLASLEAADGSRLAELVARQLAHIDAIDTSTGFLEWRGHDYPNIIGLHGDYDSAQGRLAHGVRYEMHVLWDIARLSDPSMTSNLPDAELAELAAIVELVASASRATFRAAALEAFVITPEDWARIRRDTEAASGLRPPSFFRSILALEYSFSSPAETPMNLAGRKSTSESFPNAMTEAMVRLLELAPRLAKLNGGGRWIQERMARKGIWIGNDRNTGLLAEAYQDAYDLWHGVDRYGWGVIGFFHGVPAPPAR